MAEKVSLDYTEAWKMDSNIMGYTYDIKVSIPKEAPPEKGFPIYYMLDGNSYFQFGRDVVHLQSGNAPKTFVHPSIVVGIGHAGDNEQVMKRRFYDFTPPALEYKYPDRLKGMDIGEHGGAEKLLAFFEQELMPTIHQKYPVNIEKQVLFGHSLSGLFVLLTVFTRPELFQFYLAASPSIWWNDHELLTYAERYYANAENHEKRKILMTVGSEEGFMVDDAKHLFSLMNEHEREQLEVELFVAQDENHASVVPTIMSRAFRMPNI